LLDPFCGTGGILLEGGLIGCKVMGGDISERMVEGTLQNLHHFGIKNAEVRQGDVAAWTRSGESMKFDAIVTDMPYGRAASTAHEPIEVLYERAFRAFRAVVAPKGYVVVSLPTRHAVELGMKYLSLSELYMWRVHRSLMRFICVYRPPPPTS
jgi:tRNA (guanine10-N2)-dimethyltransferase